MSCTECGKDRVPYDTISVLVSFTHHKPPTPEATRGKAEKLSSHWFCCKDCMIAWVKKGAKA